MPIPIDTDLNAAIVAVRILILYVLICPTGIIAIWDFAHPMNHRRYAWAWAGVSVLLAAALERII